MEPKPLYGALTVYRERGAHLRRLEQSEKAKAAYDEATKTAPEDVRLLIGRSQVCADAVQPHQAYADAERAAKLEPGNMNALNMQARALYTMSDFERSIVMNYRGQRLRKQPPYFSEGISQCIETIHDCIGQNAGQVMLDFLPLIKKIEDTNPDENEPEKVQRVSRIPRPELQKKLTQMEARQEKLLSRVLAMKYLGPMASDKFFLQDLDEDPRLNGANSKGSKQLKGLVKESLKTLCERQEILRTQRPYYSVKLAERSESKRHSKYLQDMLENERYINTRIAERSMRSIDQAMREHKIMVLMSQAQRFQTYLDSKTPRTLPEKDWFTDRLYRTVGEGYLCQHRLSYRLSERGQRRRIAFLMGMFSGRPSSYDSVIANYPHKFHDIKTVTQKTIESLEMCENAYMKCFLQYELARLLTEQKNYALAKFYAKRCQREADDIGSVTWWLNGCFALMSGDMAQGNSNDIRIAVEEALEYTKKMQESDGIRAFLLKCAEMTEDAPPADDSKAVRQREREILRIMDDATRVETQVLFKRIGTSDVPLGNLETYVNLRAVNLREYSQYFRKYSQNSPKQHYIISYPIQQKNSKTHVHALIPIMLFTYLRLTHPPLWRHGRISDEMQLRSKC